ncbi:MAG: sugar nucleotide-binding protein, partial [Lachnospiraceae bacterium]|nr:sugar nucleotide-binding protein [Lachnospiraceae bacterium]
MRYLILGASSYIGGYLYDRMKENNVDVIGTQCHVTCDKEFLRYDILHDDIDQVLQSIKEFPNIAVICIAQTNFDRCADDFEMAHAVNVVYMKKLICRLQAWNIKVIYISSDNVFDGEKGNYTEQDKTNAIGKYGMMKEEMEHFILDNFPNACILRIAKPISERQAKRNLLTEWEHKKKERTTIFCIRNNYMSFVAMEDIFKICMLA